MKKVIDLLSQLQFHPCEKLFKGCNPQNVYDFGDCPVSSPNMKMEEKRNMLSYISGDCGELSE